SPQVALGMTHVEVVEDHSSAWLERPGDVVDHRHVVRRVFEVTQAREETQNAVEYIRPERTPHVLVDEPQIRRRAPLRALEAPGRQIEACDVEPSGGQLLRISSRTTTEVEHGGAGGQLVALGQPVDERGP